MKTFILVLIHVLLSLVSAYDFPKLSIEAVSPKGLHVRLPFTNGDKLFAFHANVNKRISQRGVGDIAKTVTRATDGQWEVHVDDATLKEGDTIYYWVFISNGALGFRKPGEFLIQDMKSEESPVKRSCSSNAQIQNVLSNLTLNVETLTEEVSSLKNSNDILKELVEKDEKLSTTLGLDGIVVNDTELKMLVQAIITDKLGLPFTVNNVERKKNGRVEFKVGSIDEKLQVISAAKTKLKYSRYILTY